jgi:glucose-6-phosphate 1-dehydrogenase
MIIPDKNILVIFGASGDLTKRKLIPALYNLFCNKLLPGQFAVLGVSRTTYSDDAFRKEMQTALNEFLDQKPDQKSLNSFLSRLFYQPVASNEGGDYATLKQRLSQLESDLNTDGNTVYYLSTPPNLYGKIPESLGLNGLSGTTNNQGWKRLIVEKPFGLNLESSKNLNQSIQKHFNEDQIYRIDHYLGKETVQNIIAFRFSNGIFEPLWNRNYIDHVQITAAEQIGVETRGSYYDDSGALRDMLQNHLLQILATIAMEPPARFNDLAVRDETVKVFQSLRSFIPDDVHKHVVRGQYISSKVNGEKIQSYRTEKNVPPDSRTETFVAVKAFIDNWRWGDVPFYIRTGKRLPTRVTEIVIHFKKTPHMLFTADDTCEVSQNQLIVRIQPDEGIVLRFGMKMPGAGFQIKNVNMDFHYQDLGDIHIASAYERLLLDCMLGDATLYARADAVEACWTFVDPILNAWKTDKSIKLYGYPAGTWGPKETSILFGHDNKDWHYPCKNLTTEESFCEL